jgi:type II secretory pathway pseudopilin PulG
LESRRLIGWPFQQDSWESESVIMSDSDRKKIERQITDKARSADTGEQGRQHRPRPFFVRILQGRWGFTYVELVTVLLLLGVLSAIATKALVKSKSRAFAAAVESDLRSLAVAQEDYFAAHATYYDGGSNVQFAMSSALGFSSSPGVSFELRGDQAGWTGRAVHEKLIDRGYSCAFYTGLVEPYPPAVEEGIVTCRPALSGSDAGQDGTKDKKDKKDKGNNGNGNNGNGNGNNGNNGNGNNGNGNGNNGNGNGNGDGNNAGGNGNGNGNGKNG